MPISESRIVSLRIPEYLLKFLNETAKAEGRSRGSVMRRILQGPLDKKWREEDESKKNAEVAAATEERTTPFDPDSSYPRVAPIIARPLC